MEQDRLLLRISTQDEQLFQFWLTRRFVRALWPALEGALTEDLGLGSYDPSTQRAALAFQQQKTMEDSDHSTDYNDEPGAANYPLGDEPLLLSGATLKKTKEGSNILSLRDVNDKGISIEGANKILQHLYNLLAQILDSCEWDLGFKPARVDDLSGKDPEKLN